MRRASSHEHKSRDKAGKAASRSERGSPAGIIHAVPLPLPLLTVLAVAAAANLLAFALCGLDKRAARLGRRRVAERTLVAPVVVGGPFGLLAGMRLFRHKTVKRSFQAKLAVATILWLAWVVASLYVVTTDR